jgi:hypothetical protein
VTGLIEQYGIDAKLFGWEPEVDCPRKVARNEYDPCGARCGPIEGGERLEIKSKAKI